MYGHSTDDWGEVFSNPTTIDTWSDAVKGRIATFWKRQVQAEYASAAISAQFAHWLIAVGAPSGLVTQALDIVKDELLHAERCHEVLSATGYSNPVQQKDVDLSLIRRYDDWRQDVLWVALNFYCLGETAASPLFVAMRKNSQEPVVLGVYDRILQDEPRHANFGWLSLAWMDQAWPEARGWLHQLFPAALQRIAKQYVHTSLADEHLSNAEISWGMIPRQEYSRVFQDTVLGLYSKHLRYYDVNVMQVWESVP